MEDIAATMREGLLAMAVSTGLAVMDTLMDESVRHGSEDGSVALGGRRLAVRRPRVRGNDGSGEVPVPAYELFNSTDLFAEMAMARMLAKLSTRRYRAGLEPVGSTSRA